MLHTRTSLCLSIACMVLAGAVSRQASAQTSPLSSLAIHHGPTLNENLMRRYGGGTNVDAFTRAQFMQPTPWQRVVSYDATAHMGNGLGAALAPREIGQSTEGAWSSTVENQINLATGAWIGQVIGIDLPADMGWTVGVAHNSVAEVYSSTAADGSYHGPGWSQLSQPEIFYYSQFDDPEFVGTPQDSQDVLYIVFGNGRYAAYRRQDVTNSNFFVGVNGVGGIVERIPPTPTDPELWVLTDQLGQQFTFFGFLPPTGGGVVNGEGQLWKKVGTDGSDIAHAGDPGDDSDAMDASTNGYTADGRLTNAVDSAGRVYEYTYSASAMGVQELLESVTASVGATVVAEVEYTYFNDGNYSAPGGDSHPTLALRSSTSRTRLSDGTWQEDVTYFRYDSAAGQTLHAIMGSEHILQANRDLTLGDTLSPNGLDTQPVTSPGSPPPTGIVLEGYTKMFLKHDATTGRVVEFHVSGSCGCSSSTDGRMLLSYGGGDGVNGDPFGTLTGVCEYPGEPGAYEERYRNEPMSMIELERTGEFVEVFTFDSAGQPLGRIHLTLDETQPAGDEVVRCCETELERDPITGEICAVETEEKEDCCVPDLDGDPVVLCADDPEEGDEGDISHCTTFTDNSGRAIATFVEYDGPSSDINADIVMIRYKYFQEFFEPQPGCWDAVCPPNWIQCDQVMSNHTINIAPGLCSVDLCGDETTPNPGFLGGSGMGSDSDFCFCQSTIENDPDPGSWCPIEGGCGPTPGQVLCPCTNAPGVGVSYVECYTVATVKEYAGEMVPVVEFWRREWGDVYCAEKPDCDWEVVSYNKKILLYEIFFTDDRFRPGSGGQTGKPMNPSSPIVPANDPGDAALFGSTLEEDNINERHYHSRGVSAAFRGDYPTALNTPFARWPMGSVRNRAGEGTTYTYESWHTGRAAFRPEEVKVTEESVDIARNGSGVGNVTRMFYREDGTPSFVRQPDGRTDYTYYDDGLMLYSVADVTPSFTYMGESVPSGFGTSGGAQLATEYAYDDIGRMISVKGPTGLESVTHYTQLANLNSVVITATKTAGGSIAGPVGVSVTDRLGRAVESGTIAYFGSTPPSSLADVLDESKSTLIEAVISGGELTSLTAMEYEDVSSRVSSIKTYHSIDHTTPMMSSYDEVKHKYDTRGRRVRTEDATGTIDRVVYDLRNRPIERWTGTIDTDWPINAVGNMIKVSSTIYDGLAMYGPGLVTHEYFYPGGGAPVRLTQHIYDNDRRRKVTINPEPPHFVTDYDEADRPIYVAAYTGDGSSLDEDTYASDPHPDRVSLSRTMYDERGREYARVSYGVHTVTGTAGDLIAGVEFVSESWFDRNGRVVKTAGGTISKTEHDSVGRATRTFLLARDKDSGYSESIGGVQSDDVVISESWTEYDADGRVITTASIERNHDAPDTYTGALDPTPDDDFSDVTHGRVSASRVWYDDLERGYATAVYGDAASLPAYSYSTPPTSSATVLVSTVEYDEAGRAHIAIDPKGTKTKSEFDAMGRVITRIANYDPMAASPGSDVNVTVEYVFEDGLNTKMRAYQAGGSSQDTVYTYGVSSATGSHIASNRMLHTTAFPDSAGASDVVSVSYNALAQPVSSTDQAGNVFDTTYDDLGRATSVVVSTLAGGFDGSVRRIDTSFNELGQLERVTQFSDTSGTTITDELEYEYDDYSELVTIHQDFNSAVGASGSVDHYTIEYTTDVIDSPAPNDAWTGIDRTERLIRGIDTGSGRPVVQHLEYTIDTIHDPLGEDLRRTTTIHDALETVDLVDYTYMGAASVVGLSYPYAQVDRTLYDPSTGDYDYLDPFGRVTTDRWTRTTTAATLPLIDRRIAYDLAGNITGVEHLLMGLDRAYTYDGVYRLVDEVRGDKHAGTPYDAYVNAWTLDALGNQTATALDYDNDSIYDTTIGERDRDSDFNAVNEITQSRELGTLGYSAATYDAVGNLTDDGQEYAYVYDPFGRLVETRATGTTNAVTQHRYNGVGHRIAWRGDEDASGAVDGDDPWTYGLYDERWRLLLEIDAATPNAGGAINGCPTKAWVHHHAGRGGRGGSSYIDALACVQVDAAADGTYESRLYYVQNWRNDVVVMLNHDGAPLADGYQDYTAYGEPIASYFCDYDSDGGVGLGDFGAFGAANGSSFGDANYDVRVDYDRDGDVDLSDFGRIGAEFGGTPGVSSLMAASEGRGYGGYVADSSDTRVYHVRHRVVRTGAGRWINRDPIGYADGMNQYRYGSASPVNTIDPGGLAAYTIDGTDSSGYIQAGKRSKVYRLHKDIADRPKYYWDGPDYTLTGLDAHWIVTGVQDQICDDWCKNQDLDIDLFGFSRGGAIALQVSRDLGREGCCCRSNRCGGYSGGYAPTEILIGNVCNLGDKRYDPVAVRFVGLFDAVNMVMGTNDNFALAGNVASISHAVKTDHSISQIVFPTISTPGMRKFDNHNGTKSTHSDIGFFTTNTNDSFTWLKQEAKNAGVVMR